MPGGVGGAELIGSPLSRFSGLGSNGVHGFVRRVREDKDD